MHLGACQIDFIDAKIKEGAHHDGSIIEAKDPLMYVMLWNPLAYKQIELHCPNHANEKLRDSSKWTHNSTDSSFSPRLLYHVNGRNVILVSAIYICHQCDKHMRSHHPAILKQCEEHGVQPNFHLFTSSGVTQLTYETIVNCAIGGMSFEGVSKYLERSHGLHNGYQGILGTSEGTKESTVPGKDLCRDIFIKDFNKKLKYYEQEMQKIKPLHISQDHTFKTAVLLKIKHERGKMTRPFSTLFLVLDEGGRVASFTLTRTKSLEEITGNLRELFNRGGKIKTVYTDVCCADSNSIKSVFGDVAVKLDIFHGVSRVTRECKKRKLSKSQRKLFNHQLRLCVRREGDCGIERKKSTASVTTISNNLERLETQWMGVIAKKAVKEIRNLLRHARKGCLR